MIEKRQVSLLMLRQRLKIDTKKSCLLIVQEESFYVSLTFTMKPSQLILKIFFSKIYHQSLYCALFPIWNIRTRPALSASSHIEMYFSINVDENSTLNRSKDAISSANIMKWTKTLGGIFKTFTNPPHNIVYSYYYLKKKRQKLRGSCL